MTRNRLKKQKAKKPILLQEEDEAEDLEVYDHILNTKLYD